MSETSEKAARILRLAEASAIVKVASGMLIDAVKATEAALGGNHDATEAVREALRQCRVACVKTEIAKQRAPWP